MIERSSRRQVLVFISLENLKEFVVLFYKHTNINRALKNIKSDIMCYNSKTLGLINERNLI